MSIYKDQIDDTEAARRKLLQEKAEAGPMQRAEIEKQHGRVWDTRELMDEFTVDSFMAPFVAVRRKSDGKKGSLEFQHAPRFYYSFTPYDGGSK